MKQIFQSFIQYLVQKKRIFVPAFLIIAAIILYIAHNSTNVAQIETRWANVSYGDFDIYTVESGEIQAVNATYINAPREWGSDIQIVDMAPEGKIVKPGDFLIQFDTGAKQEELENAINQLTQLEADLQQTTVEQKTQMNNLESDLKKAVYSKESSKLNMEQMKFESKNRQDDAILEYKKSILQYEEAQKKIESQKIIDQTELFKLDLQINQVKSNIDLIKVNIEKFTILAPTGGMVVYQEIGGRHLQAKHKVAIGDKPRPGESLIQIPDFSAMKLITKINENDINKIENGQKSFIVLEAFPGIEFTGAVSVIAKLADKKNAVPWWRADASNAASVTESPSFEVTLNIDRADSILKPGMTGQAKILIKKIPHAIFVPLGTVFETEDSTQVVFTKKSYPNPVKVKLGDKSEDSVVIVSGLVGNEMLSWISPNPKTHPLGWYAETKKRYKEKELMLSDIERMKQLGITGEPTKTKPSPGNVREQAQPVGVK